MKKVLALSLLLLAGIVLSQSLPLIIGEVYSRSHPYIMYLTMVALSFIMIEVGCEFEIDKSRITSYGWDYLVAMTAATLPWIFVVLYFVFVLTPAEQWFNDSSWKDMLLLGRFAAPTSAGVLFTMLTAAGLGSTWMFRKARVLAIFDDLDTVLLLIPLTIMMIGLTWQLGIILIVMAIMLTLGYRYLRSWQIPDTWPWILTYAFIIGTFSKAVLLGSLTIDPDTPLHIEVLLPAFLLGCMIKPSRVNRHAATEETVSTIIASVFMVLVGLNMPHMELGLSSDTAATAGTGTIFIHVLAVTLLSNLGKMFPLFCYRQKATFKERLALSIGLFPRGEVGAGVIMVSLGYGIGGEVLTIAMLSLTLNLFMTGLFIYAVRRLLLTGNTKNRISKPIQTVSTFTMTGNLPHAGCYEKPRAE